MPQYKISELPNDFEVLIVQNPKPPLKKSIQSEVDHIWEKALESSEGHLFNGQFLSAIEFQGESLLAEFVDYKLYLAQLRKPSLKSHLQIRPLCISGFTHARTSVLIGKRGSHVSTYAGAYELVPSGGIDPKAKVKDTIDLRRQFMLELKEEAGIEESSVVDFHLKFLIEDLKEESFEVCAEIKLAPKMLKTPLVTSEEYSELFWIAWENIPEFIIEKSHQFVPLSLKLLQLPHGLR